MSRRKSAKPLRLSSYPLTERAWWYEELKGITVVVQPHGNTQTFLIRWQSLWPAVQRIRDNRKADAAKRLRGKR